ncbi:MAG: hypothetical protein PHE83_03655 [Opitutaceae bacterium]|nr:hypothetical protein [Opitutaceae bacterium]
MERLNPEQLEQMVHAALRSLPDRRAPASLEARLLAEIERRAAIPWWHKSYAGWPGWARIVFLGLCGGLACLLVFAGIYVQTGFDAAQTSGTLASALAFAHRVLAIGHGLSDFGLLIGRTIPALWFYGVVAFIAGLYAMLFGLGATAYRILWAHH